MTNTAKVAVATGGGFALRSGGNDVAELVSGLGAGSDSDTSDSEHDVEVLHCDVGVGVVVG